MQNETATCNLGFKKEFGRKYFKIFTLVTSRLVRVTENFEKTLAFSNNFTRTCITYISRKKKNLLKRKVNSETTKLFRNEASCQWAWCERKATEPENRHDLWTLPSFVEMIAFIY